MGGLIIRALVLIGTAFYIYRLLQRVLLLRNSIKSGSEELRSQKSGGRARDPFQVLGVSKSADWDEIKGAYKKALAEYHPDKVAHLGDELKSLAGEKTKEILGAYQELEKRFKSS